MVNTEPEVAEEAAGGSTATAKPIAHLRHSEVVLHTKKKNITKKLKTSKKEGIELETSWRRRTRASQCSNITISSSPVNDRVRIQTSPFSRLGVTKRNLKNRIQNVVTSGKRYERRKQKGESNSQSHSLWI